MIALLQRVSQASVTVEGEVIGRIGAGLLVLLCAEPLDTERHADKMLAKILKLRIFNDEAGKMNRSVQDVGGGLLVESQSEGGAAGAWTAALPVFPGAGACRAPGGAERPVRCRDAGGAGQ